ncbi:DUF1398 domain-containing protein [Hyphomonas johnsonii]|uniref:DUF1398 domain-containing protein n=1 Tax=Hyphomonas johnsonii MHS-2 TaxID=1280950 RepID=A0A059FPR8_9PROT|nr:hypothetical protein [Hyphomonas johnsonii]KCZ92458.1 hypothetical protein HJO_10494 [Hyphomonas johnsonii MHS-2]
MDPHRITVARASLDGAEQGTKTFPQIVGDLMAAGFESYMIDFRRATATYYLPDGESTALEAHPVGTPVAAAFDADAIQAAIRDAQNAVPGYTYAGFCERVAAAGCAGYIVSFPGRRALYFGRTAETLVEPFPA